MCLKRENDTMRDRQTDRQTDKHLKQKATGSGKCNNSSRNNTYKNLK